LWCYRNELDIAIAVVDAAADFLIDTKRVILVSIGYFVISFGTFIIWVFAEMSFYGLNNFEKASVA